MPTFPSNPFRPSGNSSALPFGERIGVLYRRKLASHPFLLFGLPFISLMVMSSFLLTPATALRFENHDRKNREVSTHEALNLGFNKTGAGEFGEPVGAAGVTYNPRRRILTKGATSERDEYYKLMAKDLDNWEQKRVERWKGEPDGRL
ncbi:Cytochrome oxidase assembly [Endocarpon pusillum]|uniref:Cytochrome c oxidase assembly protein COX16, mitochondrial n=1 Tax=Endocarpon pusillum TaxID=364733 RepID=A0A8H7DZD3_9EURO|nr:Cytochrome oxidase assembly [Endocarpon pusillum]